MIVQSKEEEKLPSHFCQFCHCQQMSINTFAFVNTINTKIFQIKKNKECKKLSFYVRFASRSI